MVRPLNSTSSTSTTTLPSTPPGGISVGSSVRAGLSRRSSRYMVTSSEPTGTSYPSTAAIRSAIRRASGTPRLRDAEQDEVAGALVALEDLVGDAGQRPRDVTVVEDRLAPSGGGDASCSAGRLAGHTRVRVTSFSASLDGSLKDVDRRRPYRTSMASWRGMARPGLREASRHRLRTRLRQSRPRDRRARARRRPLRHHHAPGTPPARPAATTLIKKHSLSGNRLKADTRHRQRRWPSRRWARSRAPPARHAATPRSTAGRCRLPAR